MQDLKTTGAQIDAPLLRNHARIVVGCNRQQLPHGSVHFKRPGNRLRTGIVKNHCIRHQNGFNKIFEGRTAVNFLTGPVKGDRCGAGIESGRITPIPFHRHILIIGVKYPVGVGKGAIHV